MKVLVISHAYVERDNHRKLEEMSRISGLEVGVVYPSRWKTWHGEAKTQNSKLKTQNMYKEFPLDTFRSGDGGRHFYHPWPLFLTLKKFAPDLIHLEEEPFALVALEVAVFCRWLGVKMVFFAWENIDLPLGPWRGWLEKFVFKTAAAAVAGNAEAKKRLERRSFGRPVEIIPQFGVDTELFRPIPVISEGGPLVRGPLAEAEKGGSFVIGFVGRPAVAKGLDLLFEAAAKLGDSVRLLVVSSSSHLPDWLTQLVESLGVQERVEFCLGVPHRDLPAFFRRMDVFVLPSRTTPTWKEQFGRTLVEAMACGVPVVGSSSGAIPEVIGDAGMIFAEGNVDDLVKKVNSLSAVSERRVWSEKGRERVRRFFDSGVVAQSFYKFFDSLVGLSEKV